MALIAAIGVILRLVVIARATLSGDEAYSAAVAQSPLIDVIVAGLRYDVHPPLYYLQLHVWALFGDGDGWLLLNSFAWAVAGGVSLFWVIDRLHGRAAAIATLAVFAVLPLQVWFAGFLRMYAMTSLIAFWLYYWGERAVAARGRDTRVLAVFAALAVAMNLTHGSGFLVSGIVMLFALVRLLRLRDVAWGRLVLATLPIALSACYSLVIGALRETVGQSTIDLTALGQNLTIVTFGMGAPWQAIIGAVLVGPFLLIGLFASDSGPVMRWLVILPLLALVIVSVLVKPILTYRSAGLFTPFLVIGLGLLAAELAKGPATVRQVGAAALLAVLLLGAVNQAAQARREDFGTFARAWAASALPSEVLYTDDLGTNFLGVVRYLPGARLDSILDVQRPTEPEWRKVAAMIGPDVTQAINLLGKGDRTAWDKGTVARWYDRDEAARLARPYGLFNASPRDCTLPGFRASVIARDGDLTLWRCTPSAPSR